MLPGTILLIRSKGFIPDQIRLHMKVLARQFKTDPLPYNHAEVIVMYEGQLMSMGARAGGAEMTPLIEYLDKHSDFIPLFPVEPLTVDEVKQLEDYARDVCYTNKRRYQYGMFFAWIAKLKTWGRLNWGEKGNARVYCFELANDTSLLLHRGGVKDKLISVYDLWENLKYRKP